MERYQPRTAVNRRALLWAGGAGALAPGALACLAGCGIPPARRPEGALGASEDRSAYERTLGFSDSTECIDSSADGTGRPALDEFRRSIGIEVTYTGDTDVEFTGIPAVTAYNQKATEGPTVDSVSQPPDDPRPRGRVGLLSEMCDTVGLTLLDMGRKPEKVTAEKCDAAVDRLRRARDRGQIRPCTGNDYTGDLNKGDIAACIAWAGDFLQLQADNIDIPCVIPDAGYMLSSDNLPVPRTSRHQRNAERLIDYCYQPEVAAPLAATINCVSPATGLRDELTKIDRKSAGNSLIIHSETMPAKAHAFRSLTAA
ncbi:extracellular solute-binding protein [Streptomyces sp. URMC 124]|uniref:extracellular solute-binding protein n=1 Tax=Streptomyces sp. URMC 124 TaxID=3423405 RepID=UPI003F1AD309